MKNLLIICCGCLLSACMTESTRLNSVEYSQALNETANMSEYDKARYMSQKGFGNEYILKQQNHQIFKMKQRENQVR